MRRETGANYRAGSMAFDPSLDEWRLPPSDRCWWCGAPATTMEHRIKHSTLRRVGRDDHGNVLAANVFKKADDFEGSLSSLKKGSQVKWRKNLCAPCNNARSQPFDFAYDQMETFLVDNADTIGTWDRLRWIEVYGGDWQTGSRNLARYFAKQLGCMLAGQQLPVPEDVITFLDGADRCPSVDFALFRNWRAFDAHKTMVRDGFPQGITTFVGLHPSAAYQRDGTFSGVDYGYHIGYVWFILRWRLGIDHQGWWESSTVSLPMVNDEFSSRVAWRILDMRQRASRLLQRLGPRS